jgi:REP element-mobilizing transposase RayT
MPRRLPIDPQGYYHVGSRGNYGRTLFGTLAEYELFLALYTRAARKYNWKTLTWSLMVNHYHFIIKLTRGGLSDGMRETNGQFSRRINAANGMTGKGHLVRHAFFARELKDDTDILVAARYVDLNEAEALGILPEMSRWGGFRATIGLDQPRSFHQPAELLGLISHVPEAARRTYRKFVHDGLDQNGHDPSPNQGGEVLVQSRRDRYRRQPRD